MNDELAGLRELAQGFQKSAALLAAVELGVFSALKPEGSASSELAGPLGCDPRALDRLLCALCGLGLLRKQGQLYLHSPQSARLLDPKSDEFVSFGHTANQFKRFAHLAQSVRSGTCAPDVLLERRDPAALAVFIEAMHGRAWRTASRFPELIGARGVRRVLDVGGGSGVYAMAFLAAGAAEAVVLDLPEVIALTKNYVAKAGLALQVFYIEGDYHTADFASGYDVVLFSAILHINSADENRALLRKASQALNSGGKVAVEDFILNDERTGPQRGTLFSLNMLVSTRAGDTYSEAEISSWMREAGLGEIVRHETGPGSALLVGRKP